MAKEIELKLEVAESGLEALLSSGLLGDACKETDLRAIYFDTPDRAVQALGHSLRIRTGGGAATQTIKADDPAAGLFSRGEWELPVAGKRPVADSRTPLSDLLSARLDALIPAFEVPVTRKTFKISSDRAEIEIALDRAEIVAGERSERFCEVELELLSGPSEALFTLANKIDAITPVRISALSKAERGYRLLGALQDSVQAEDIPLDRAMSPVDAFAAIAGACLRQYRLNEAILLDRYVPEAVHQARVGLRRLRSAMVVFKPLVDDKQRTELNERVGDLARCLGEARDLDVLAGEAALGAIVERLGHARDAAHSAVSRKLKAKATRLLLLDLSQWVADGAWRSDPATAAVRVLPLRELAAKALDKRRRKVSQDGRHFTALDPEARHTVRKDAKKLRYAVEFLAPLFGHKRRRKAFARALRDLQEQMGTINDRAMAEARLAELGLAQTPESEAFLSGEDTDRLLQRAAQARHALLDIDPFWR